MPPLSELRELSKQLRDSEWTCRLSEFREFHGQPRPHLRLRRPVQPGLAPLRDHPRSTPDSPHTSPAPLLAVPRARSVVLLLAPGQMAIYYTGLTFVQVSMTAMGTHEDLNNERMQRTMYAEGTAAQPAHDEYSTTGDSTSLDMAGLASELHGIVQWWRNPIFRGPRS